MSGLNQDKVYSEEATKALLASLFSIREKKAPVGDTISPPIREDEIEFYSDYKMSEHLYDIYMYKCKISIPIHFYCDQQNCSWVIYQIGVGEYKAKYYGKKENIFSRVNNDTKFSLNFLNSRGLYGWIQTMINEWDSRGNERNTYMLKFIGSSSCKIYRSGYKSEILLDINYFLDTYFNIIWINN